MATDAMSSKINTMKYLRASNVKRLVLFNSNILTLTSRS
jgi:hypothetical protein